jgi:Rrf2 family transcriptional regulator, nitric oxide-sensitive transcriptional repressor
MRLTLHSNHAIRLLTYCALHPNQVVRTVDIARANNVSEHHLTKIAQCLAYFGIVETIRGRSGGITLAKRPEEIVIGEVIRITEDNLEIAECFNADTNTCPLASECRFGKILRQALAAFLAILDGYTLADLIAPGTQLRSLFGLTASATEDEKKQSTETFE